ncbi:MAG: hypothetical protein IT289_04940 [Oligoflexia bacterium]|nr:hypothetical protein [Oligoflexia bacterium]
MKIRSSIILAVLYWGALTWALPPEGFESKSLLGRGSSRAGGYGLVGGGYNNQVWTSDFSFIHTIVSFPTESENLWTFGGFATAHNRWADRTGYFGRFDFTFGNHSVALKHAHLDYTYIRAGKNTVSLTYNGAYEWGMDSHIYLTLGAFYRFTLQRWNGSTWSPINFKTDDSEYYPEITFGYATRWDSSNLSVDVNNRDAFHSYNGDHLALDVAYSLEFAQQSLMRLVVSSRFSSWLSGTADISEQKIFLELIRTF